MSNSNKSSFLNLYDPDNLDEKTFFLLCSSDGVHLQILHKLDIQTPIVSLSNQTEESYNIPDLGKHIFDKNLETVQEIERLDGRHDHSLSLLNNEIVERVAADTTIQSALNREITRATNSENTINDNLALETQNRIDAVNNERSLRQSKDIELYDILNNTISIERNARINSLEQTNQRIDTILEGADIDFDTLREITLAFQNADIDILTTLNNTIQRLSILENKWDTTFPQN